MRIQLWSYFYDPEPQGIAPLSRIVATELQARRHEVLVIAAHPHYPEPRWGYRLRPYRDSRDGIPILRLPLWIGRKTAAARIRQEVSFTLSQSLITPLLPTPDVVLAVTPCFPALAPVMAFSKVRRVPWVMWLQDIVTDAAETTGLVNEGKLIQMANRFERAAYTSADRIVVISEVFRRNLLSKGVEEGKIEHIFNPAPRPIVEPLYEPGAPTEAKILVIGNIGHSQGLDAIVDAFEADEELARLDAKLVFAGHGVAADAIRDRIVSDRVQMLGVLDHVALERELRTATVGLVSQRGDIAEFNFPSKLMNYMASGLPVIASVRPGSETARVVTEAGAGWVTDARSPAAFAAAAAAAIKDPEGRAAAGRAGFEYARRNFDPATVAGRLEAVMTALADPRASYA
jgi:colanic acid biosynthesis glycosyl transferase WcaI